MQYFENMIFDFVLKSYLQYKIKIKTTSSK